MTNPCKHEIGPWPGGQQWPRCLKCEIERLRGILTYTTLTPNAPAEQFKAVLDAAEKGEFVNAQDLINALWWRVRNQRGELRKKNQDIERLRDLLAYILVESAVEPSEQLHESGEKS